LLLLLLLLLLFLVLLVKEVLLGRRHHHRCLRGLGHRDGEPLGRALGLEGRGVLRLGREPIARREELPGVVLGLLLLLREFMGMGMLLMLLLLLLLLVLLLLQLLQLLLLLLQLLLLMVVLSYLKGP